MSTRVEIRKLVDPVQYIGNQLLEEDTGRHSDLATELPRHGVGQLRDIIVIAQQVNTLLRTGMLAVDVSNLAANESKPFQGERGESDLHRPRVVEPEVRLEVDVETLGERLQPLD